MSSRILDPHKITKETVPAPSFEKLNELVNKTYAEISTLSYLLKRKSKKNPGMYLDEFIHDCIYVNGNRLLSILKLNQNNLNTL